MKNCDYYVSDAYNDPEKDHIIKLKRHTVKEDNSFEGSEVVLREIVVADIENGLTYMVIFLKNGKWQLGKEIHIYNYKGTKYLRTDKDETPADNLDSLAQS